MIQKNERLVDAKNKKYQRWSFHVVENSKRAALTTKRNDFTRLKFITLKNDYVLASCANTPPLIELWTRATIYLLKPERTRS